MELGLVFVNCFNEVVSITDNDVELILFGLELDDLNHYGFRAFALFSQGVYCVIRKLGE